MTIRSTGYNICTAASGSYCLIYLAHSQFPPAPLKPQKANMEAKKKQKVGKSNIFILYIS